MHSRITSSFLKYEDDIYSKVLDVNKDVCSKGTSIGEVN
jgi:hypothetical protein